MHVYSTLTIVNHFDMVGLALCTDNSDSYIISFTVDNATKGGLIAIPRDATR